MDIISSILIFAALILLLASLFSKLLVGRINYQFKPNAREEEVLNALQAEEREKYFRLLQELKFKKYCCLAAAVCGLLLLLLKFII